MPAYSSRMLCANADNASATDLRPSRRSQQILCSCCCRRTDERWTRFAGGWPRAFCSSTVVTAAASCCNASMTHHSDGWWWFTVALNPLFQASQRLLVRSVPLIVGTCTFHTVGGNSGGSRRITRLGRVNWPISGRKFLAVQFSRNMSPQPEQGMSTFTEAELFCITAFLFFT